ncbi:MAG: GFA family protein [Kofleriaceae bacterium]
MTYQGSCHCGAVRYEVDLPTLDKAFACNCSICRRAGWLLAFVDEDQFHLLAGADAQSDYQFAKKHIHHTFCRTCGIHAYSAGEANGKRMVSINLRCLDGLDPTKLPVEWFDGASL